MPIIVLRLAWKVLLAEAQASPLAAFGLSLELFYRRCSSAQPHPLRSSCCLWGHVTRNPVVKMVHILGIFGLSFKLSEILSISTGAEGPRLAGPLNRGLDSAPSLTLACGAHWWGEGTVFLPASFSLFLFLTHGSRPSRQVGCLAVPPLLLGCFFVFSVYRVSIHPSNFATSYFFPSNYNLRWIFSSLDSSDLYDCM